MPFVQDRVSLQLVQNALGIRLDDSTAKMLSHSLTLFKVLLLITLSHVSGTPTQNSTPAASVSSPLLPISPQVSYWTTSTTLSGALPLADSTFRPHNQISALTHSYVDAPDGRLSMQAIYPEGSYTFSHDPQGGFSFYAPGPASVDLTTAKEATFGYTAYFPSGFDFVKGGKVPGLCT